MNSFYSDLIMYAYVLAFLAAAVAITMSGLYKTKSSTKLSERLLLFNLTLFLYLLINFIIFFSRQFGFVSTVSSIVLIAFDITHVLFIIAWIYYLNVFTGLKSMGFQKVAILVCGTLYVASWCITYFFFLDKNEHIFGQTGQIIALAGELAIFIASVECTIYSIYKSLKNKNIKDKWYLILTGTLVTIYFVWFLIYEIDAIFRFVGPSSWLIYPFDWIIFLCITVNIVNFIYIYPKLINKDSQSESSFRELQSSISEIGDKYALTAREKEILQDIALNKSNTDIAEHYTISIYTVKRHINSIYKKTNNHGRKELIKEIHANIK